MNNKLQLKQAYLIMAHKCDLTFLTLLKMLDEEYNDIFIHMDSKNKSYNKQIAESNVLSARVFHTQRIKVTWGGGR